MTTDKNADILVIGGGIGGLTCALALQRQGLKVRVYEEAPAFGEAGAGITLGLTACRGLFSLGLREQIEAQADIPAKAFAVDYRTGEPLQYDKPAPFAAHKGPAPFFHQMHRADLHALLLQAVTQQDPDSVRSGHRLVRFEQDANSVRAEFANGAGASAKLLIGADGINSAVRAQMFGREEPRFTGQVAYRFLAPMEAAAPFMTAGTSVKYAGPGRSLLRYVVRKGTMVNGVAFVASDSWVSEGWSSPATTEELLTLFEGWHPDVLGLFRVAPPSGTRKWALVDRDPLPVWVQGRAALLGDSAHPMLPFLGLGAAMAIEDAIVLARALVQEPDVEEALQIYQGARASRAGAMLLASRRQGDIFADGPDSEKRPPISYKDRLNYDPMTVAL